MDLIESICCAIATAEGAFHPDPNVAPRRTNNPGDIMESDPARIGKLRLRKFTTLAEGTAALYADIAIKIRRGLTLRELISIYAPPNENDTSNYINETVRRTGIDPDVKLWTLLRLERIP